MLYSSRTRVEFEGEFAGVADPRQVRPITLDVPKQDSIQAWSVGAIADIVPRTFGSARAAYDAMIRTAQAGTDAAGRRTSFPVWTRCCTAQKFYGPDGARDWACVFAAGPTMVVVHSQRDVTSFSALALARELAAKFS